ALTVKGGGVLSHGRLSVPDVQFSKRERKAVVGHRRRAAASCFRASPHPNKTLPTENKTIASPIAETRHLRLTLEPSEWTFIGFIIWESPVHGAVRNIS